MWRVNGTVPVAQEYRGRERIFELFRETRRLTDGTYRSELSGRSPTTSTRVAVYRASGAAPRTRARHRPGAADRPHATASGTRSRRSRPTRRRSSVLGVRVGVQLPEVEREVRWPELAAMARAAEECGFDSLWVGDHLLYRGDGRAERGPWDCWTTLAALAAVTERVELGPLVACTAFHPPGILARAGGGGRRAERRPARRRPRRRVERGRVPRVRPAVRPPRLALRGGVHDHPPPARRRAGDLRGPLPRGRRRAAPAAACAPPEADGRRERAADARDHAAPRRRVEHLVHAVRQHAPRGSRGTTPTISAAAERAGRDPGGARAQRLRARRGRRRRRRAAARRRGDAR